jgi:hypothetical protein
MSQRDGAAIRRIGAASDQQVHGGSSLPFPAHHVEGQIVAYRLTTAKKTQPGGWAQGSLSAKPNGTALAPTLQ